MIRMLIKTLFTHPIVGARHRWERFRLRWVFKQPSWYRIGNGLVMYLDPSDYMDRLFYLGSYDRILLQMIRDRVRKGDLCVDVGAQKGYVALQLSKQVGKSGLVMAFEPDSRARKHLDANLARNKAANTTVFPFAFLVIALGTLCT